MTVEKLINAEAVKALIKEEKYPQKMEELFKEMKKMLIEKALEVEMEVHLGYPKHGKGVGENRRNGSSAKQVKTESETLDLTIPRDRDSSFEPTIVRKGQAKLIGFGDKVLSMYARGMSMRDIQTHLEEIYGIDVSPELISNVTEKVMEEVIAWQNRPLDKIYPLLYLDVLFANIKENNQIMNKAVYIAVGVNMEGQKEVLGLWIAKTEGAKFWLSVITELKNRGVQAIYIACVDGLTGFKEAIHTIFPQTTVQLCIVHMVRNSLKYVSYKDRRNVAGDLKPIYTAPTADAAQEALFAFDKKWSDKYPTIANLWTRHWQGVIPFLAFPDYIRKAIYTTNAIESINSQIRKIIRSKGSFPNDEAALKLIFLTLQNAQKKWTMPIRDWSLAVNQFAIMYDNNNI